MVIIRPSFFKFLCAKIVNLKFKRNQGGRVSGDEFQLCMVFCIYINGGGCEDFVSMKKEGLRQKLTKAELLGYQVRLIANKNQIYVSHHNHGRQQVG